MSRSLFSATFPDGEVRYGLWNGTVDAFWGALFELPDSPWDQVYPFYRRCDWAGFFEAAFPRPQGLVEDVVLQIEPEYDWYQPRRGRAARNVVVQAEDDLTGELVVLMPHRSV